MLFRVQLGLVLVPGSASRRGGSFPRPLLRRGWAHGDGDASSRHVLQAAQDEDEFGGKHSYQFQISDRSRRQVLRSSSSSSSSATAFLDHEHEGHSTNELQRQREAEAMAMAVPAVDSTDYAEVATDPYGVRLLNAWYVHLSWNRTRRLTDTLDTDNLSNVLLEYGIGLCKHQQQPKVTAYSKTAYGNHGNCAATQRVQLFYPVALGLDWGDKDHVQGNLQSTVTSDDPGSVWQQYYLGKQLMAQRRKEGAKIMKEIPVPQLGWPDWFNAEGVICEESCEYPAYVNMPDGAVIRFPGGPLKMKQWAFEFLIEAWCPNLHKNVLLQKVSWETSDDFDRRRNILQRACIKMPGWLTTEEMRNVFTKYFSQVCVGLHAQGQCEANDKRSSVAPNTLGILGRPGFAGDSMPRWLPDIGQGPMCYLETGDDKPCKPIFLQPGNRYRTNFGSAAENVADTAYSLNLLRDYCEGMVEAKKGPGGALNWEVFDFYFKSWSSEEEDKDPVIFPVIYEACKQLHLSFIKIAKEITTTTSTSTTTRAPVGPTTTSSTTSTGALPAPLPLLTTTTTSTTTPEPTPCIWWLLPLAFLALFCCCTTLVVAGAAAIRPGDEHAAEEQLAEPDEYDEDADAAYLAERESLLQQAPTSSSPPDTNRAGDRVTPMRDRARDMNTGEFGSPYGRGRRRGRQRREPPRHPSQNQQQHPPGQEPAPDEVEPDAWDAPPANALDPAYNAVTVANEAAEGLIDDPTETASTLMSAGFSPEYAQELADAITKIPRDADNPTSGGARRRRQRNPRRRPTTGGRDHRPRIPSPHRDQGGRDQSQTSPRKEHQQTGPGDFEDDHGEDSPRDGLFHVVAPPGGGDANEPDDHSSSDKDSGAGPERATPASSPGSRYNRKKDKKDKDAPTIYGHSSSDKDSASGSERATPASSAGSRYNRKKDKKDKDAPTIYGDSSSDKGSASGLERAAPASSVGSRYNRKKDKKDKDAPTIYGDSSSDKDSAFGLERAAPASTPGARYNRKKEKKDKDAPTIKGQDSTSDKDSASGPERATPASSPGARYNRKKDKKDKDAPTIKGQHSTSDRDSASGPERASPASSPGARYNRKKDKKDKDAPTIKGQHSTSDRDSASGPERATPAGSPGARYNRKKDKKDKDAPTIKGQHSTSDRDSASGPERATPASSPGARYKRKKEKKDKDAPSIKGVGSVTQATGQDGVARSEKLWEHRDGQDQQERPGDPNTFGIDYPMPLPKNEHDLELLQSFGLWSPATRPQKEGTRKAKKTGAGKKKAGAGPGGGEGVGTSSGHEVPETSDTDEGGLATLASVQPGEMGDAEHVRDFLINQWKKQMYQDEGVKSLLEAPPELSVFTPGEVEMALVDSGFSRRAAKLIAPLAQAYGKLDHTPPRLDMKKSGRVVQGRRGKEGDDREDRMKKVALPPQQLKEVPVEKMDPEDRERFWNNFRCAVLPPGQESAKSTALEAARKKAGLVDNKSAKQLSKSKSAAAAKDGDTRDSVLNNFEEKDDFDRRAVETAQIVLSKCRRAQVKAPAKSRGNDSSTHSPGKDDASQHYLDTAEAEKVLTAQGFSRGIAKKLAKFLDDQLQERARVEGRAAEIALDFLQKGGADDLTLEDTLPRCAQHILKQIAKEDGIATSKKAGTSKKGKGVVDGAPASPLQLTQEDAERIGTKALAEWKLQAEVKQFTRKKEPTEDFDVSKGFDAAAAAGLSYELADAITADDLEEILEAGGVTAADGGAEIKAFVESNFVRQNVGLSSTFSSSNQEHQRQLLVVGEIMKPSHVRSFISAGMAQRARDRLPRLLGGGTRGGTPTKSEDKKADANAAELAAEVERSLGRCAVFETATGNDDDKHKKQKSAKAAMQKKLAEKLAGHLLQRGGSDPGATERICFNENGPLAAAVLANFIPAKKSGTPSSASVPSTMTHLGLKSKSSALASSIIHSELLTPGVEYKDADGSRLSSHVANILPGFQLTDAHLRDFAKSGATATEMKMLSGFRGKEQDYVLVKGDEKLVDPEKVFQSPADSSKLMMQSSMQSSLGGGSSSMASQSQNVEGENFLSSKAEVVERVNLVQNFQVRSRKKHLDQIRGETKKKKPNLAKNLAARARGKAIGRGPRAPRVDRSRSKSK